MGLTEEDLLRLEEELLENPVSVKWDTADRSASFQMNSVCFQENFLLDLIVSVQ